MTRPRPYLLTLPGNVLLVGLLATPLILLARVSLYERPDGRGFYKPDSWTFGNFAARADAHGMTLLTTTFVIGVLTAIASVGMAYPLVLMMRRTPSSVRRFVLAVILLPKLAGPLVVLFGLQQLLSASGLINRVVQSAGLSESPLTLSRNWFGTVAGETYLVLPYVALVLYVHMMRIDPALESAARGLGASRWQTFVRVTWPLSRPGLAVAGQLALIWGIGSFFGPLLLGGPDQTTLGVEVYRQAFEYGRWPVAAADAILLLGLSFAVLAGFGMLARRRGGTR